MQRVRQALHVLQTALAPSVLSVNCTCTGNEKVWRGLQPVGLCLYGTLFHSCDHTLLSRNCSSCKIDYKLPFHPSLDWRLGYCTNSKPPYKENDIEDAEIDEGEDDIEEVFAEAKLNAPGDEQFHLLTLNERYQRQLRPERRAILKRQAESLLVGGKLVVIRVGKKGITRAFLLHTMRLLDENEILRVRIDTKCGLKRDFVRFMLENCLDCAFVAFKGHTVTLYRDSGLPKPEKLVALSSINQGSYPEFGVGLMTEWMKSFPNDAADKANNYEHKKRS